MRFLPEAEITPVSGGSRSIVVFARSECAVYRLFIDFEILRICVLSLLLRNTRKGVIVEQPGPVEKLELDCFHAQTEVVC